MDFYKSISILALVVLIFCLGFVAGWNVAAWPSGGAARASRSATKIFHPVFMGSKLPAKTRGGKPASREWRCQTRRQSTMICLLRSQSPDVRFQNPIQGL